MWKGESVSFNLTTTAWASSPTVSDFKLYDQAETDVTAGQASGSSSVSGDVITTPKVAPTGIGRYRWVLTFTAGGLTFKAVCDLDVSDPLDIV